MSFADDTILVGTHDGQFHADEVLAMALFDLCLENEIPRISYLSFPAVRYCRTRDEARLAECDVLLDVGGRCETVRNEEGKITKLYLDHHQGLQECHAEVLPLATFGLTWGFLGERLIQMIHYRLLEKEMPWAQVHEAYEEFRRTMVLGVDATDNGVDLDARHSRITVARHIAFAAHRGTISRGTAEAIMADFDMADANRDIDNTGAWRFMPPGAASMAPAYSLTLSRMIADVNPTWIGEIRSFNEAKTLAASIIRNRLFQVIAAVVAGDHIQASTTMESGSILLLDKPYPWEKKLRESQVQVGGLESVLYVIYPRVTATAIQWVVQAAPAYNGLDGNKFVVKKLLPAEWVVPGKTAAEATGIKDVVYVNPGRWIAVADNLPAAVAMAKFAVTGKKEEA